MTRHHRNLALHHLTVLTVLSTTVLPGAAAIEDLDAGDVPPECALACAPIAQLTERCEAAAEQQFGSVAVGRRWTTGKQRRQKGMKRSLQRMLEKSLSRRQEADGGEDEESDDSDSDNSDDSNDNDDDEEEEKKEKEEEEEEEDENRLASGNVAETEGNEDAATEANQEATGEAMRACVCGERGFDVAAVAFGCATCVAQNVTAVDAAEDIRQLMANCGFIAATDPPALASTTTTPPALSTLPLLLAPVASGTETSPPPSPASPTSTSFPPAATTTQDPSPTSITPVTVFETPTFSTLPSLILPNDFSSAPHVLDQDGNQMSGAVKGPGTALCRWMGPWGLVFAVVVGWLLS